jgi:hypothetical protein
MARRRRSGFREGPERHLPSSACMVGNTGLTPESLGFATGDGFSVTRIFSHPEPLPAGHEAGRDCPTVHPPSAWAGAPIVTCGLPEAGLGSRGGRGLQDAPVFLGRPAPGYGSMPIRITATTNLHWRLRLGYPYGNCLSHTKDWVMRGLSTRCWVPPLIPSTPGR